MRRTFELAGESTLVALHSAILEVFELEDDHAYAFFMNGHAWDDEFGIWSSPRANERGAAQRRLDELGLPLNKRFLYLLDYGDEQRFDVRVQSIIEDVAGPSRARVIEAVGTMPQRSAQDQDEPESGNEPADDGENAKKPELDPTIADLAERLDVVVSAWAVKQEAEEAAWAKGAEDGEGVFGDDDSDDDEDEEEGDEGDEDEDEEEGDENEGDEETSDVAEAMVEPTLDEELALALDVIERTNADERIIATRIEEPLDLNVTGWLMTLPERLDRAERSKAAVDLAQRLILLPGGEDLRAALPAYLFSAGDAEGARECVQKNLEIEPEDYYVLFEAGRVLAKLEDFAAAERHLREALKFAGTDLDARELIVDELLEVAVHTGADQGAIVRAEQARLMANRAKVAPGSAPIRRDGPKVGRNDPCPCGSGKKYKKCCGLN